MDYYYWFYSLRQDALTDYPDSDRLWDELAVSEYWLHEQKDAIYSAEKAKMIASTEQANDIHMLIINEKSISHNIID